MTTSENPTPTLRGYAVRRPFSADSRQEELGPYERSYELRRGYEAPGPRRDTDRDRAQEPATGR